MGAGAEVPSGGSFPTSAELEVAGSPVPSKAVQYLSVEGRQAILIETTYQQMPIWVLVVHDVDGVDVTLTATDTLAVTDIQAAGGLVSYFESIKVFGANRADWTTDVVG